jgi:plastocyanin
VCLVWGWVCGLGGLLPAAEWGDLSGRFVLDGVPPVPEKVNVTTDKEECCKHDLKVESLLVNPDNKGIENVIIYLFQNKSGARSTASDAQEVPIHESYLPLVEQPVTLDNKACRFNPHVCLVWTRQKVILGNSDPIGHNVKIDCRENRQSNDTIPSGGTIERTFDKAERLPARVTCSIHPWMCGWLVIRDTPYMAVTDADGKFTIKNLPAGQWQFMCWHEQAGYVSAVKVSGKPQEWKRGITTLTIKPGQQDLGDIVVGLDLFK